MQRLPVPGRADPSRTLNRLFALGMPDALGRWSGSVLWAQKGKDLLRTSPWACLDEASTRKPDEPEFPKAFSPLRVPAGRASFVTEHSHIHVVAGAGVVCGENAGNMRP
jgi:hypothetical protein